MSELKTGESAPAARISLLEIFLVSFQIGIFSVGGGLLAWIHREIVTRRGWLKESEFFSSVVLAQILPGTNVSNLLVHVGHGLRGGLGSIVALMGLLTGPFFIVIGLSEIYRTLERFWWVQAMFDGITAAAVGLLLAVGVRASRVAAVDVMSIVIVIGTFVAVAVLRLPLFAAVVALAAISITHAYFRDRHE